MTTPDWYTPNTLGGTKKAGNPFRQQTIGSGVSSKPKPKPKPKPKDPNKRSFWDRFWNTPAGSGWQHGGATAPFAGTAGVIAKDVKPPMDTGFSSPSTEWNQSRAVQAAKNRSALQLASAQPEQESVEPDIYGKTIADFLAQAQSVTGSGVANQLAALAAQREQAKSSATQGDTLLSQMYQALQNQTGKDTAATQQRYAEAQAQSKALTDQSQAALLGANQAVNTAQNDTLANLGIAGANDRPAGAAGIQEEAARIANSQNQAIGNTRGQELLANSQSQGNLGLAMGTAAQFAGAGRRSELQNALMKYLQEIGGREAQLRDQSSSETSNLAGQLMNDDYSRWQDQRQWETGRDDEAWQRSQATQSGGIDPQDLQGNDRALYDMQASGVPPQAQRTIMSLIAQGANNSGTDAKGMKTSTFQGAYRAIQEAIANGTLPANMQGQAISAAVAALGSY